MGVYQENLESGSGKSGILVLFTTETTESTEGHGGEKG